MVVRATVPVETVVKLTAAELMKNERLVLLATAVTVHVPLNVESTLAMVISSPSLPDIAG